MSYLSNEVACSTMRKRQEKGNLAVGTSRVESERSRIVRETNHSFRDPLVHGQKYRQKPIPASSSRK
jgi:hypothetical protein